jgi:hypothetical protein
MSVLDDIKDTADAQSGSSDYPRGIPAGIPDEIRTTEDDDEVWLKAHGDALLDFERIVGFTFTGDFTDEQNIRQQTGFGDDYFISVEDATVDIDDQDDSVELWQSTDDEENSVDFKLVDTDHPKIEEHAEKNDDGEWEVSGVDIYGRTFYGKRVDDIDAEYTLIPFGGSIGQHVARVLDTRGAPAVGYDDPDGEDDYDAKREGLIEYPYGWFDENTSAEETGYPAIRRVAHLRQDLIGQPARFAFHLSDETYNGNHQQRGSVVRLTDVGSMAVDDDGNPDVLDYLGPDDDVSTLPEYPPTTVWRTLANELQAQQSDADTEYGADPTDDGADAQAQSGDMTDEISALGGGDDGDTVTYDEMASDFPVAQTIVDGIVDAGGLSALSKDLSTVVDDAHAEDGMDESVTAEDIETAVEQRKQAA